MYADWGPDALEHMIELYLNPDQDGAWEEKEGLGETKLDDVASNNIAVAERLLRELKPVSRNKDRYNATATKARSILIPNLRLF